MDKWISRKLITAVGSVVTVVLVNVGLPEAVATQITDSIAWIVSAYLVGQGAADAASAMKR